jgi:thiol reductant ABC exporter CydD subunit
VIATLLLLGQTLYVSRAIDLVFLRGGDLQGSLPLLGVAALLLLGRSALGGMADVLLQHAASSIKGDLRRRLSARLFGRGPAYLRGERSGELLNTLGGGVEVLDEYITQYLPARLWAVINPLLVFAAILWLDAPTTLVLLFAGPMLILLLALIGGQAKRLTQKRFAELSYMSAFFLDIVQGLPTLKLFGRSREQAGNIERISRRYGDMTLQVLATAFQSSLVMEWAATAATAMVALVVSLRLVGGSIEFVPGLAVLLLTPEFFLPLRQLAIKYHAGAAGKAAQERIEAFLDEEDAAEAPGGAQQLVSAPTATSKATGAGPDWAGTGDIVFERLNYTYPAASESETRVAALDGVSFVLPQGKVTALVGPSGAGKTTVANLLLRFLEPCGGQIVVGRTPLAAVEPGAWREQVAWVPQQPYIFSGTAAKNIALGSPQASRDEVLAAAKAAHTHEFIAALPQGYDTPLGEQGVRLSGGQRQRLAIARAFLKDAPVVILDEAGASLDAESERLIEDALARLLTRRTVLVIAHRLNLSVAADQVLVLQEGRLVEQGSHRSLSATDTLYRRLAASYAGEG